MTNTNKKYFLHPNALCESSNVGDGTRIWAFTHILPQAKIGGNCNICDQVFIENDVTIGDNVTVKCGVQIWDGITIGNDVFIGPNVTFTNDRFPRSKEYPEEFLKTVIEDGASIGANATILPGIKISRKAMIGAGSVVTRDVPPFAKVVGNPAVIIGYDNPNNITNNIIAAITPEKLEKNQIIDLGINGCFLQKLPHFVDMRGELIPLEVNKGLPFEPARIFLVYGVKGHHVRGEHAHYQCKQFLIASHGSVSVVIDDGQNRKEIVLNNPQLGLYLAPMTWGIQYKFSNDAVLMVVASHTYDGDDYIRNYDHFLSLTK